MPEPHASETHILPGDPPVEVRLRRSKRAKRYSLRVSRSDGGVSLSVPVWAPQSEALAFLREREAWVRRHLAGMPGIERAQIGAKIPICDVPRPILAGAGRAARFQNGCLYVPEGPRQGPRVKALLTAMARERLTDAVMKYATRLGRPYGRITLRDPKSRWGSCSGRGDLMFSWRLIMAPPAVLDYVAAHEVAHLQEMNHSAAFWSVCAELCPEYKTHQAWLKTNGARLLSWRFDSDGEAAAC